LDSGEEKVTRGYDHNFNETLTTSVSVSLKLHKRLNHVLDITVKAFTLYFFILFIKILFGLIGVEGLREMGLPLNNA
jgi:hypothetical protein